MEIMVKDTRTRPIPSSEWRKLASRRTAGSSILTQLAGRPSRGKLNQFVWHSVFGCFSNIGASPYDLILTCVQGETASFASPVQHAGVGYVQLVLFAFAVPSSACSVRLCGAILRQRDGRPRSLHQNRHRRLCEEEDKDVGQGPSPQATGVSRLWSRSGICRNASRGKTMMHQDVQCSPSETHERRS